MSYRIERNRVGKGSSVILDTHDTLEALSEFGKCDEFCDFSRGMKTDEYVLYEDGNILWRCDNW